MRTLFSRKTILSLLLALLMVLSLLPGAFAAEEEKPEKISVICTSDDHAFFERVGANFTAEYGIPVEVISQSYDNTYQKITTSVAGGIGDVTYVDTVWPAELGAQGVLLPLDEYMSAEYQAEFLDGAINQMRYEGSLYGIPYSNNGNWMFYNKAKLAEAGYENPPETWQELKEMSLAMMEQGIIKSGIAFAGKQAEGLICHMTTMLYAFGGKWQNDDGTFAYNNTEAVEAVQFVLDGINEGWMDAGSVNYSDREVLDPFLAGDTAFVMNWSYVWGLGNDPAQSKVAGDISICLVPGSEKARSAAVTGGGGLGIMASSSSPEYAAKFIQTAVSVEEQADAAEGGNVLPSLRAVYEDPAMQERYDFLELFYPQFEYSCFRPAVPNYNTWSNSAQLAFSTILSGQTSDIQGTLDTAVAEGNQIIGK